MKTAACLRHARIPAVALVLGALLASSSSQPGSASAPYVVARADPERDHPEHDRVRLDPAVGEHDLEPAGPVAPLDPGRALD